VAEACRPAYERLHERRVRLLGSPGSKQA